MAKEVSDKVIVFFIIIAVVVSVLGTFFVYTHSNIQYSGNSYKQNNPTSVGYVGIIVLPADNNDDRGNP